MSPNIFLQNGELVIILIKGNKHEIKKKKFYFLSLRWILLATYVVIGIVPLLLIASTILHSVQDYFIEERKKELLSQANVISGQITSHDYLMDKDVRNTLEETILQMSQEHDFRVLVLDSSCLVVYDTGYSDAGKTVLIPEVIEALQNKDIARKQEDGRVYAAVSISGMNNSRVGVVLISDDMKDIVDTIANIAQKGNLLLAGLAIIVIIVMFFMSQIFTEPIKKMIKVIQKMSEGHFEQRVQVHSRIHNEVVDLALACNQMADQLEKVESTRQQFVSNVSHELKTPLSSIKVLSESILLQEDVPKEMYVEFLHDINSEVDRMAAIINDLLTLVKLDQKEVPLNFKETDLNEMIEGIIKRLLPLAQEKKIFIHYEKERDVVAMADEMKLTLAIANLVDNAIKYTPENGSVVINLDADHQNAFISVADTGIGIPDTEVGRIFERFYRVDKTRDRETGGTGLGLSITHSTIMMHNGSIKVYSKEEEGTTILVRIPIRQSVL
ncbi:alkaline phosphatase synthesis sensor protein PhoR [Anaerotignum neopropionicum]|uniref:histidine kinase n=1 Tax=Anaerotignum neopropionicum TaxID=36847 RepID=A0A136WEW9_9FIRM|nr:ATP-binding protein [Anaerotignum neopropionicum]KXL53027.1 alkaline phosphatase synthesis sensor protein PhoR [Anaerotignum neopropionicum]